MATFRPEFKPRGITVDGKGTIYTSGWDGKRFVIAAFPKKGKPTRRPIPCATSEGFSDPTGASVVATPEGVLFWAKDRQYRVVRINPDGTGDCYAGTGADGFSGDGGPATNAQFELVTSLAYDPERRDLYVADANNRRVRRIEADGTITTVVGPAGISGGGMVDSTMIAFDARRGRLYVREQTGIAYQTRDGEMKVIPQTDVPSLYLTDLAVDPTDGSLVSTGGPPDTVRITRETDMIRISVDGAVRPVREGRLRGDRYAEQLTVNDEGDIWVVTRDELIVIRPGR